MDATAHDSIQTNSANTNGLDHLFENQTAQDSAAQVIELVQDKTPQDISSAELSTGQDWTISEAAKALGISEKTVLRRLQRGSLTGYKVPGQFGQEWRVNRTAKDTPAQVVEVAQDRTPQDALIAVDSSGQDSKIDELKDEIRQLRQQLEGAIYRNGYLEAKLEDRESTIKLLTDSQSTRKGWWARFSSWFFHGQPER